MSFDITEHLGAVRREVQDRVVDGASCKAVIVSRVYDTTPTDLWNALTTPERLKRFFAPVSGDLKLNGRYHVEGNASGTITRCDPEQRVELTWEFMGFTSWVNFSLSPSDGGTLLKLEHIAQHPNPHWDQYGSGAAGVGWELSLLGLAEHFRRPSDDVRAEGVNGWETSDEAKQLVRASTDGWGEAEIAAGEKPEQARKAAENSRRFYSGEAPMGS